MATPTKRLVSRYLKVLTEAAAGRSQLICLFYLIFFWLRAVELCLDIGVPFGTDVTCMFWHMPLPPTQTDATLSTRNDISTCVNESP